MTLMHRRTFLKTMALAGSGLTISLGLSGCNGGDDEKPTAMRFAVLSDPHVYDPTLGTTGTAFETYLAGDRKMLVQSAEILSTVVSNLLSVSKLDVLIIPGDMTKDGELLCHRKAISLLKPLRDAGIKVYVVPGNHDINNPDAKSYQGSTTTAVANITPEEFSNLYADYGYSAALYRHANSLSYIVEPVEGVWLFAIDSCKYADNASLGTPVTSGALSDDLLGWIKTKLAEAKSQGKVSFGMLHHGVVAHFASQPAFFPEYLLDEYASVGQMLAEYGLQLVFTGHFHAQDGAVADYNGDGSLLMYDIETGSTVTSPCAWRIVDLDIATRTFKINSFDVNSIPSMTDFASFKETFIEQGMLTLYQTYLASMGVTGTALAQLAPLAAALHVAHFKGDEAPSASTLATLQALMASTDTQTAYLGKALYALAVDPGLADNNLSVTLDNATTTAVVDLFQRLLMRQTA